MKEWLAKREGPLLVLVTLLALMLGLVLPDGVAALQDAAARRKTAEVPPFFSEPADILPLVQAFWRRAYFYEENRYDSGTPEALSDQPTAWLGQLLEAGALPEELYRAALTNQADQLESWIGVEGIDGPAWRNDGPLGFTRLTQFDCDVECWEDTVVSLNLSLPYGEALPAAPALDLDALLDAYLAYCGLDGLEDWQPMEKSPDPQCRQRMLYSPEAQLYALIQLDTRTEGHCRYALRLGWLSRDTADAYAF